MRKETPSAIPNIISFDWLRRAEYKDILNLSPETLKILQDDLSDRQEQVKLDSSLLKNTLNHRFGNLAGEQYKIKGTDTGTVHLEVEGSELTVKCTRSKTVQYDQKKLEALYQRIADSGDQPDVYISKNVSVSYAVSENAFKTWPMAIQAAFSPARTIVCGTPSFTIEMKKGK